MNHKNPKTIVVDTEIKKDYLNKKINSLSWTKKWSIFYALVKVSKKKIKQNVISFKPNFLYVTLIPILGYIVDQTNTLGLSYGHGYGGVGQGFLNKTLPGVNKFNSINSSKLSWETFNYTNYFKKIKWNTVNKINYFDGSIFISFNPNFKIYNKQYYIGSYNAPIDSSASLRLDSKSFLNQKFFQSEKADLRSGFGPNHSCVLNSNNKTFHTNNAKISLPAEGVNCKKYFLSGRYYNQFCKHYCIKSNNKLFNTVKPFYTNQNMLCKQSLACFKKLSYWQNFFSELDHIPNKLNNIYFSSTEAGKEQSFLASKKLLRVPKTSHINKKQLREQILDQSKKVSVQPFDVNEKLFCGDLGIKNHPFYLDTLLQKESVINKNLCQQEKSFDTNDKLLLQPTLATSKKSFDTNDKPLCEVTGLYTEVSDIEKPFLESKKLLSAQLANTKNGYITSETQQNLFDINKKQLRTHQQVKNQTPIEKQSNQLNFKLYTQNNELWNRRLFQYKIDKNIFLFRNLLNSQINNFANYDQPNEHFVFMNKKPTYKWKTKLRNDIRNLGNTKIKIIKKINDEDSITLSSSIRSIKKFCKEKPAASFLSKFNLRVAAFSKNKKLLGANDSKLQGSLVPKFQSMLFKQINTELFLLDSLKYNALKFNAIKPLYKKETIANIPLKTFHTNEKLLCDVKNTIQLPAVIETQKTTNIEADHTQKISSIRQKIQQGKSDLIKRKLSGYLYADNSQKELVEKLHNSSADHISLSQKNKTYIQIQGPKGLMHSKFKQVSSSSNNTVNQYSKWFNTTLKNYELIQNQTFFGAPVTDFGVAYTKDFSMHDIKESKEQLNKKKPVLDLSAPVVMKRCNAKAPFAFWKNPENKWWLSTNNLHWLNNKNISSMNGLTDSNQPILTQTNSIILGRIKANEVFNLKSNQSIFTEKHINDTSIINIFEKNNKLKPTELKFPNGHFKNSVSICNSSLIDNSSFIETNPTPTVYKNRFEYTKTREFSTRYAPTFLSARSSFAEQLFQNRKMVDSKKDFGSRSANKFNFNEKSSNSNIVKVPAFTSIKVGKINHGNFFTLKSFTVDLYETVSFKKWALLTQISFLLIVFKTIDNIQKEYQEAFILALENFFSNFELESLTNLKQVHGAIVQSKKTKFRDLVAGIFLLEEFTQTILLLRNARKLGSQVFVSKPGSFVSKNNFDMQITSLFALNSSSKQMLTALKIDKTFSKSKKFFENEKADSRLLREAASRKKLLPLHQNEATFSLHKKPKKLIRKPSVSNDNNFFLDKILAFNSLSQFANLDHLKVANSQIIAKGFLLVGPPGTGKTLLVKALSGEADIPVVLDSGENLSKIGLNKAESKNIAKLKKLFKLAKKMSPCILFLDEIDTIGQNRKDVLKYSGRETAQTTPNSVQVMYCGSCDAILNPIQLQVEKQLNCSRTSPNHWQIFNPVISNSSVTKIDILAKNKLNDDQGSQNDSNQLSSTLNIKSLALLTQLLCELDGVKNRQDIVVIGATNRPATLDPALVRPGRLGKVVYLDLPGKQKRFELLKFYSQLGTNGKVDWNYFSNQTAGLSAAHLSSAMNRSALKAIYQNLNANGLKDTELQSTNFLTAPSAAKQLRNAVGKQSRSSFFIYKKVFMTLKSFSISNKKKFAVQNNFNVVDKVKLMLGMKSDFVQKENFKSHLPVHSFKTIEYGIETIRSRSRDLQYESYTIGNQINNGLFGIICYNKLISFFNTVKPLHINKKLLRDQKAASRRLLANQLRNNFYNKHKKYIRTIYLLNNQTSIKSSQILVSNEPQSFHLWWQNEKTLAMFNQYINRIFKAHLREAAFHPHEKFGRQLLNYSTCIILNPSILFETNFTNQNLIQFKLLYNNKKGLLNLHSVKKAKLQYGIFGDSIFINRAAYYIAGKALILRGLKQQMVDFKPLSLWSLTKKPTEHKNKQKEFIQQLSKQFLTKIQFENYLLSIIAGKSAETLMLINFDFKNQSDLGIEDLQKMGWLLNILIEKNLFYQGAKLLILNQVYMQLLNNCQNKLSSEKNTSSLIGIKLNNFANLFDKQPIEAIYSNQNNLAKGRWSGFWSTIPYWWETKIQVSNSDLKHGQWTRLFTSVKQNISQLNSIEHDIYFQNFTNTQIELSKQILKNQLQFAFSQSDSKILTTFNKAFLWSFLQNQKANWNSLKLLESDQILSNLLFNSFNKAFNILEQNRELLDFFAYRVLCYQKLHDFEITKIFQKKFNSENSKKI